MLVLICIAITLLVASSKNVKYIFPLTDWSHRKELDIDIGLTFLVDMIYLVIINALYLSSYEIFDIVTSNNQVSILLKLPEFIN